MHSHSDWKMYATPTSFREINNNLPSNRNQGVPPKPFYVVPSHFYSQESIAEIVSKIDDCLSGMDEVSYEFYSDTYHWEAVHVKGSSYCKFSVRVYLDRATSSHLIEATRLTGDTPPFYQVYQELLNAFTCTNDHLNSDVDVIDSNVTVGCDHLSETEFAEALKPLFLMADQDSHDAQLIAAQILCDLSFEGDMQRQQLCDHDVIHTLAKLVCSPCENIRRLSVFTIAQLSQLPMGQNQIIETAILPTLISWIADGPYYNAEMRRTCARIVANVSSNLAAIVIQQVGKNNLLSWMESVDRIHDPKLRSYAVQARDALIRTL